MPFKGWDFSYLHGRMVEEQPPWSYEALAAERMDRASSVLDIGTGGGERLLALCDHWPPAVAVTEDYPPNVALARKKLAPLGVRVEDASCGEDDPLPFDDGAFDLVLDRHSGINASEIARILAPGGVFLTQQIHGLWAQDLIAAFDAHPAWPWETPEYFCSRLDKAGMMLDRVESWQGSFSFTDVGAIVYYLKAVPWIVDGFTVDTHRQYLIKLQEQLEQGNRLIFEARKYLIEAHKP